MDKYLEAIYVLGGEGQSVIGARIAEYLGVTPPTVTQTLKRLEREGYIQISAEKEISLTEKGMEASESIVRKHRLIERFLADMLGFDWVTAHEEAGNLEHAISPRVEQRLFEVLNHPTTCPHGNPIPGTAWQEAPGGRPLDECQPGDRVVINRILEHVEDIRPLLEFLDQRGLVPGADLEVLDMNPYAGGVRLRVNDDQEITLAMETASKIWVAPR